MVFYIEYLIVDLNGHDQNKVFIATVYYKYIASFIFISDFFFALTRASLGWGRVCPPPGLSKITKELL